MLPTTLRYLNSAELVVKLQKACGVSLVQNNNSNNYKSSDVANGNAVYQNGTTHHRATPQASMCQERTSTDYREKSMQASYEIRNTFLYYLFQFGSCLGNEPFYIVFLPFINWNCDFVMGRLCIYFWSIYMYLGQATKDIVMWPRPPAPPVVRLEHNYGLEHGMPSTHAMVGFGLPFTLFYISVLRYQYIWQVGLLIAVSWTVLVCCSRLYLGVHSVLDVIAGLAYILLLSLSIWPHLQWLDAALATSIWGPVTWTAVACICCATYPMGKEWNTARGDTTMILAVASGIVWSTWLNTHLGLFTLATESPPYFISMPTFTWLVKSFCRMIVGAAIVLISRAVVKAVTLPTFCALQGGNDLETRRSLWVEFPVKYITYSTLTFASGYYVPMIFEYLNINRAWYYFEGPVML